MEDLGGGRLRLLTGRDDTANGQRGLLVDQWNLLHPRHQVEVVELPGVADLQYSAMHAALQSGDPNVDAVNLDIAWIAEFAEAGYLRELERVDTDGFLDGPLEAGRIDGRLLALPFNTDVGMLYYRVGEDPTAGELRPEDAEAITDWAELRRLAAGMALSGGFDGGIAMQLDAYEGFTVNVWEYLLANGVEPDLDDGAMDFAEDGRAVAYLGRLWEDLRPEGDGPPVILWDSLRFGEDASLAAFREGRTPFLRHWPRAYRVLSSCELGFTVGAVPMPGRVLGGQNLAVSAASRAPNATRRLIEFLTGPAAQQLLFERGGFAATRDEPFYDAAAQTAGLEEAVGCDDGTGPRGDAAQLFKALTGSVPWLPDESEVAPPGHRPAVTRYTRYSRVFQEVVHPLLLNGEPLDSDSEASGLSDLAGRLEDASAGK
jgi:multiple sugar transport system substrate-binding protein